MSFKMDSTKMYMMPIQFGPCLGPRQNADGVRYLKEYPRTAVNHTIVYESETTAIEPYLPENVTLDSPHVIINHRMNRNLSWLAGHGYNLISVRVPTTFHGVEGDVKGFFMLAIWENEAEPIIYGREQLGYCKTFANITDMATGNDGHVRAAATSWDFKFIDLDVIPNEPAQSLEELKQVMQNPERQGDMNYKYIPKTGSGFLESDAQYMTLTPKVTTYPEWVETFPPAEISYCTGNVKFYRPRWEDMPTQFRIVQALEAMPIKRVLGVIKSTVKSLNDSFNQKIIR